MLDKFSHIGFEYNECLCLVLFVIHSESNCRTRALLDLEYSSYAEMEQNQIRTTFDQKTGSKIPNFLRFRSQTKRLVDQLHEKFREEFNKEPLRTFSSSTNKRFSCQATYLKAALAKFFSITDKSYNPDNVRKAWDSYKVKANFLPEENLARLYLMNTGHCEATRDKYYVQPTTDGEIAKLLDNQLDLINDIESCYVTEDDPPRAGPETTSQRKFLMSFYRTSICSSTVYQCNTCLIRFTGKGKHLKLCKKPAIVRVKVTCTNDFPENLKAASIWNANSCTGKATSLLEEYNINREKGGDPELTRFQRNFLTAVLKGTQFLRVPMKLKGALGQIQKQKKYM